MNGLFNILAALLLGSAVVVTGYALTRDTGDGEETELERIAENTLQAAEQRFRETAQSVEQELTDAEDAGSNGEPAEDGREAPYTAQDGSPAAENTETADSRTSDRSQSSSTRTAEADQSATGQQASERASGQMPVRARQDDETGSRPETEKPAETEKPTRQRTADVRNGQSSGANQSGSTERSATAGLNTTDRTIGVDKKDLDRFYTERGKPVDKPDDGKYYTENSPLIDKPDTDEYYTENRRLIDKPDTQQYYTEDKRLIDKPDTDRYFTENRRLDKPDTQQFFTENQRLPENRYEPVTNPCLREDGTIYTGPGTVQNPFAPENPCLIEDVPPVVTIPPTTTPPVTTPPVTTPPVTPPETPRTPPMQYAYRCLDGINQPINDGNGYGWLSDVNCYGNFPGGGFGPQPSIPPGGSDYSKG